MRLPPEGETDSQLALSDALQDIEPSPMLATVTDWLPGFGPPATAVKLSDDVLTVSVGVATGFTSNVMPTDCGLLVAAGSLTVSEALCVPTD